MKALHIICLSVAALLAASCSGTRGLGNPRLDLPATLAEGRTDSLSMADMEWWELYSDPALRLIIERALDNNRDLLMAGARVEELRQLYGVDKLNYMPSLTGMAGALNETNDYHGQSHYDNLEVSLKFTVNWEIDLWGGLSQARRKSAATWLASVCDRRAMEMTVVAETAAAYINLIALQNELTIVRQTLETREQALEKSRLRYEGGLTSEIVYQQAKVEVATTAALVPGLVRRIQMAKNALTLLMGEFPSESLELGTGTWLAEDLPKRLPIGLPSTLLERRPDLQAAEQRLKASLADVGIAYSNQFPNLRIALTGGWEKDGVAHLLQSPFTYLLGNITGTVFDFGRNRRKYKASIQACEQARLGYEKAVLTAFREVSDAVVTYRELQQTAERRAELRDAAFKYVDLANKQYIGGTISYIDVLDAHRRYFDAQINLSNAVRDQYLALVSLYKALGGGWSRTDNP